MTTATPLRHGASNLIEGSWKGIPGRDLVSHNPAHPDRVVWSGSPSLADADAAVAAARAALPAWSRSPVEKRIAVLRRFQEIAKQRKDDLADLICEETGKAMREELGNPDEGPCGSRPRKRA